MHKPQPFFEVDGDAIREKRKALGLEPKELADLARISRRYVSHLENGTRWRMSPGRYKRLRAALQADETELLRTPQRSNHPPKE